MRAAFGQRRKQLGNALRGSGLWTEDAIHGALSAVGVDPRVRAESLEPERLRDIARALPEAVS